jgi:hypothetical protein
MPQVRNLSLSKTALRELDLPLIFLVKLKDFMQVLQMIFIGSTIN